MTDEPFDAGDKNAVRSVTRRAAAKAADRREALIALMESKAGRNWMHDLLLRCRPFRTPFSSDPIQMSFNCGQADIGLQLIADLHEASTELYLKMMEENKNG